MWVDSVDFSWYLSSPVNVCHYSFWKFCFESTSRLLHCYALVCECHSPDFLCGILWHSDWLKLLGDWHERKHTVFFYLCVGGELFACHLPVPGQHHQTGVEDSLHWGSAWHPAGIYHTPPAAQDLSAALLPHQASLPASAHTHLWWREVGVSVCVWVCMCVCVCGVRVWCVCVCVWVCVYLCVFCIVLFSNKDLLHGNSAHILCRKS